MPLDSLYFCLYDFAVDPLLRAISILREAEGELQRVMEQEIASGHYSRLSTLAALADGLSGLVNRADTSDPSANKSEAATSKPRAVERAKPDRRSSRALDPNKKSPQVTKRSLTKKPKYPYFEIADEWIGKVGWSKKNREEYRHYAPISAALALAEHIDRKQEPGRVWTVEMLGEVVDKDAGGPLPSYQLYLLIAWMRSAGLLTKQGRSGYVAVGGGRLKSNVEKALSLAH